MASTVKSQRIEQAAGALIDDAIARKDGHLNWHEGELAAALAGKPPHPGIGWAIHVLQNARALDHMHDERVASIETAIRILERELPP